MAKLSAQIGDLDAAQAWLNTANAAGDALLREAQTVRIPTLATLWFLDRARAQVLESTGRYSEAEPYFRRVANDADAVIADSKTWITPPAPGEADGFKISAFRDLAVNLLHQDRLAEAELEIRRALLLSLKAYGRYNNTTASLLADFSSILIAAGRFGEAEKLGRVALETFIGVGHEPNSVALNDARASLMSTLSFEQRWRDALEQFAQLRAGLAQEPAIRDAVTDHHLAIVIAAVKAGQAQQILEVARGALQRREKALGAKHYETAEARGFYAIALAATGDRTSALREFQTAVPVLLAASRQSLDEEQSLAARDILLKFILEGYLDVLTGRQAATAADVAEAFRVGDAARGRSVQRAIAASAARATVKDPGLADLIRREQDVKRGVAALNAVLANALGLAADQQDPKALDGLRQRIDQLRASRATIRGEIERRFPDYIRLVDPPPATVAEVQAALLPEEALIAIYVADERAYLWAVPKQGAAAFAAVPVSRASIDGIVAQLRKALEPNASTLGDIPPYDVATAYKLYSALLAPVSGGWKGAKSLLVVPHGALGELPFALLVTAQTAVPPEAPGQAPFSSYKNVP